MGHPVVCQYSGMGMRQMTFEIPDEVAERVMSEVPTAEQSEVVTKALLRRTRPKLTAEQWDAICEAANNDPETQVIERESAAYSRD